VAKIKYDVTDVEEFSSYAGPTPKRGVYESRVQSAEFGPSSGGKDMFTIIVRIDSKKKEHKKYNGCPLWQYTVIGDLSEDYMKRNLKGLLKAFGAPEKGALDPEAFCKKIDGKPVRVIVKNEMYNDEMTAKANGLLPISAEDDEDEDDDEDIEEDEDDEAEEADDEDESDDEDEEEESDEDEEEELSVEEEVADLSRKELQAYINDNELEIKVTKKMSDDDIREAIVAAYAEDEEEDEEEDEAPF
jgi:hypothetical protein